MSSQYPATLERDIGAGAGALERDTPSLAFPLCQRSWFGRLAVAAVCGLKNRMAQAVVTAQLMSDH